MDFDYFYAQCEEIRKPSLKEKPIAVCVFSGRTADSGVVSTANYLARSYGVRSGMPIKFAKSRLASAADAELLPMDMSFYKQISQNAMSVIRDVTGAIEQVGIDECYADITALARDFDDARNIGKSVKNTVRDRTGITCSVGIAPNKTVAKMASDFQKPDGLTLVMPEEVKGFLSDMEVARIPGIGTKISARLAELGVRTVSELERLDQFLLAEEFGRKTGAFLYNVSRGVDDNPVQESSERKQIARITTLKSDTTSSREMLDDLSELCKSVATEASNMRVTFGNIAVIVIQTDLDQRSRSRTLKNPADSFEVLHSVAEGLLEELMRAQVQPARRLGVRISDLRDSKGQNTISEFMK